MSEHQHYTKQRLSDRIIDALKLALDQNDRRIADLLVQSLELAMTRQTKSVNFVERRECPKELETCMEILNEMRKSEQSDGGY